MWKAMTGLRRVLCWFGWHDWEWQVITSLPDNYGNWRDWGWIRCARCGRRRPGARA